MKTYYHIVIPGKLVPAIADLTTYPRGEFAITRINVPPNARGQGYGRQLLKQILDDADAGGYTLRLLVSPSGGLTFRQLFGWYMRYGFKQDHADLEGSMVRAPKV